MPTTLVVSPHMDDEVYSAASFLKQGDPGLIIAYMNDTHAFVSAETLQKENRALIDFLGCRRVVFDSGMAHQVDNLPSLPIVRLVDFFESVIKEFEPDTVVLPFPSYNQDHRVTYDAALTALRPHDRIPFVKRVLLFEEPETFGSLRQLQHQQFRPTYLRPMDLSYKYKLIDFYQSQRRMHRNTSHVEAIAGVRGMIADMPYAEAFEVLRWVD